MRCQKPERLTAANVRPIDRAAPAVRIGLAAVLVSLAGVLAPVSSGQEAAAQPPGLPPAGDGIEAGVADVAKTGQLPPATSELAKKAATAITKRDWDAAYAAYAEILAADPENALALANLGVVEFQRGDIDDAKTHLESAVAKRPALASCWTTLGLIHYQKGDLNLATSTLARALHEEPENAQAHNYLAVVAKARGWKNAAELELQRAIDIDPRYAEAHFNLALMYLERHPPAVELARRHYVAAKRLGAAPDALVEKQLYGGAEEE